MRRRRLIGAVVVAVVVAGAAAVRAQLLRLPSVMHGRVGTGSLLWFGRAFPELDVEIQEARARQSRPIDPSRSRSISATSTPR